LLGKGANPLDASRENRIAVIGIIVIAKCLVLLFFLGDEFPGHVAVERATDQRRLGFIRSEARVRSAKPLGFVWLAT
jgi:hypothetical protein